MRPFLLLWKIKDFSSCYLQMFSMSWVSPVWQYIHNVELHIPWVHEYHNTYIKFKFDELWPVFTPLYQLDIENQWLLLAYWCTNWVISFAFKWSLSFQENFHLFQVELPNLWTSLFVFAVIKKVVTPVLGYEDIPGHTLTLQ